MGKNVFINHGFACMVSDCEGIFIAESESC